MPRQFAKVVRGCLLAWLVVASGCIQKIADPVPLEQDVGTDLGSKFKPDTGSNPTRRIGGDGSTGDGEVAGAKDGEETAFDGDLGPKDGEEQPFDVSPTADATATSDAAADDAGPNDAAATDVAPSCGDGKCDSNETCVSCEKDCGKCPPPVCNVLNSSGCTSGKQCFPDGKANLCYAAGTGKHGDPCKQFNDCQVGALCVAGLCRQLCDWTGKDASFLCKPGVPCDKLVFEGAGEVGQNLGACKPSDACNPLTDEGCSATQTCTPSGWLKTCGTAGTGAIGAVCSNGGGCKKGSLCVDGKCRARCQTLGELPKCAAGVCTPVLGPDGKAVPEFVGYCVN